MSSSAGSGGDSRRIRTNRKAASAPNKHEFGWNMRFGVYAILYVLSWSCMDTCLSKRSIRDRIGWCIRPMLFVYPALEQRFVSGLADYPQSLKYLDTNSEVRGADFVARGPDWLVRSMDRLLCGKAMIDLWSGKYQTSAIV